jgi:hypothetical protein
MEFGTSHGHTVNILGREKTNVRLRCLQFVRKRTFDAGVVNYGWHVARTYSKHTRKGENEQEEENNERSTEVL